ncbi:MAG: hypothetical protein RMX68_028740 [Aulosira sp. ZfuVER01]|nr:hypothetical protein [Aulosira sp. ZfuVER01]MDZ8002071.1 hypothetical protein [Aulosira sp. DedVER01a]MDZ8052662.1 hypothetical protein [Aulosira sp. ZfuCHP01]
MIREHEKLHPQEDGVFGHGEWGMGKSHQCPMSQVGGRLSLSTHKRMEFLTDFQ